MPQLHASRPDAGEAPLPSLRTDLPHARSALLAGALFVALAWTPLPAHADCNLIPTATKQLTSDEGSVDRPYAAPGDTVRVFSDGACRPDVSFPHFDPDPVQNEVRLSFEPPNYPSGGTCGDGVIEGNEFCDDGGTASGDGCSARCAPEVVVTPDATADCGEDRCFALLFQVPDTAPLTGGAYPLTGPARIEVRNLADGGTLVAAIGDLFEPKRGCNDDNVFPNLFRHFSVLPPRNPYAPGTATLQATVDGSGSLLIPFDYSAELATSLRAVGSARIATVTADLPNGLAGGNGLSVDQDRIRIPRNSLFLRSFALNGRPIPPLLEATGTLLVDGDGVQYGDRIVGSFDSVDSLIRIAKVGPAPEQPSVTLQLFALAGDAEGDGTGLSLQGGIGPIALPGVTLDAGSAIPLNSLRTSGEVAVIARDEALEAEFDDPSAPVPGNQNSDTDSDDRVVQFVALGSGDAFTTGQAVTELGPPPKAATDVQGSIVAFLQSEAHEARQDFLVNGTSIDSILRVWSADPSHPTCGGAGPCELTALAPLSSVEPSFPVSEQGGKPLPLAVSGPSSAPGRFVFFGVDETTQTGSALTTRISQRSVAEGTAAASYDPDLSDDGLVVAYVSDDGALAGTSLVTWETGTFLATVDATTGVAMGPFSFDSGDADVAGLDYASAGSGTVALQSQPTADPLAFEAWGQWAISGASSTFLADVSISDPALATFSEVPVTDTTTVVTTGTFASVQVSGDLTPPSAFGLSNFQGFTLGDVVDGSIAPDFSSYQLEGTLAFQADQSAGAGQVYVTDAAESPSAPALASRSSGGTPGNGPSAQPSLDADGSHVAFESDATNLVPGDTAGQRDVFRVQLTPSFSVLRVSAQGGVGGNGPSSHASIDATGLEVAYQSDATNLVAGDNNGFTDVFVFDGATNRRVSVRTGGGGANGPSLRPEISGDGRFVVFDTTATNLLGPGGDVNGLADVYIRDRVGQVTERVSVGRAGLEADGPSTNADVSADGRFVVFVSSATNLVDPAISLPQPVQCYVRDRLSGLTQLVSATLAGNGANAPCEEPRIDDEARFVSFASRATNLHPELAATAVRRAYIFDRLVGVPHSVSPNQTLDVTGTVDIGTTVRPAIAYATAESLAGTVATGAVDVNGVSDVYAGFNHLGSSLNTTGPLPDGDASDVVFFAFDTQSGMVLNSQIPAGQARVSEGVAAIVPDVPGASLQLWDPASNGSTTLTVPLVAAQVSIRPGLVCVVDTSGFLHLVEDPSTITSPGQQAADVRAVGTRCVFTTPSGELRIAQLGGGVTETGLPARDFQVGADGVAFRSCEDDVGADLNGDTDTADCVMRFWAFAPDVGQPNLQETARVAVPCTFPGCDPFFEPYRVGPGIVSFVTLEPQEVDEGGSGARGDTCLSTSGVGVCDVTGDGDGDDAAVEIFNLASGKAQTFPVDVQNPPQVAPFPNVVEGDKNNVTTLQLPASLLGDEFEDLPPEKLVTVIVGDPEGDGVFEADGNLDPQTSVSDLCQEVANADQIDADNDNLGSDCDVVIQPDGTPLPNDNNEVAPAAIPGDDLCDLDKSGTITRPEVDQVWKDRGLPIDRPFDRDGDGLPDAADDRDRDPDGEITSVDFRLCLADCDAQSGGCPDSEGGSGGGFKRCGLLGVEVLLVLLPLAWRRRRRILASAGPWALLAVLATMAAPSGPARAISLSLVPIAPTPSQIQPGDSVVLEIRIDGLGAGAAPSLTAFSLDIGFTESVLDFVSFSYAPFLGQNLTNGSGQPCTLANLDAQCDVLLKDPALVASAGQVSPESTSLLAGDLLDAGQPSSGLLGTMAFSVQSLGTATFSFLDADLAGTTAAGSETTLDATATNLVLQPVALPEPDAGLALAAAAAWLLWRRGRRPGGGSRPAHSPSTPA